MSASDDSHRLIQRVYDTALDTAAWPKVLAEVAHHCGAAGAFVFEMQRTATDRSIAAVHYSAEQDPALLDTYLQQFAAAELLDQDYFAEMSQRGDRIELIGDEGLADHYAPLGGIEEQPHIKLQRQFGFNARAGALLNKDDYYRDRFALVYARPELQAAPEMRARAEILLPHLAKALDVTRPSTQIENKFSGLAGAVDRLNIGVCVISADRSIVFQNDEFARQLEAYDAMSRGPDGRLVFSSRAFGADLSALLGDVTGHGRHGARPRKEAVAMNVTEAGHTLCVELLPLDRGDAVGEARLGGHVVYSLDTSQSYRIRTETIARLFDLSKSEAAVLEHLADGLTNPQIAEARIKSVHTINSQVKALLTKLQVANRTQAIRLATNLSASVRSE